MNASLLSRATLAAILCIGAASCSEVDEPVAPARGDAISFSASESRAEATTTATLNEFVVYAYTEGKVLMDHVTVTRKGSTWTYEPEAYWPDEPVNFFFFSPDISEYSGMSNDGTASINMYNNPGNVDLLYAVNYQEIQSGTPVEVNFRHAFAKVDVTLSSSNSKLKIFIDAVRIGLMYSRASFTYPKATTAAGSDVAGKWATWQEPTVTPLFEARTGTNRFRLTPDPTDLNDLGKTDCYDFFIPQTLNPLTYDPGAERFVGAYIEVDCEIFDAATDGKLFPSATTPAYLKVPGKELGRILYPATSSNVKEWKAGSRYIYNITINNPAVLFDDIEFTPTVDDYTVTVTTM